jgi:hypothetical protein
MTRGGLRPDVAGVRLPESGQVLVGLRDAGDGALLAAHPDRHELPPPPGRSTPLAQQEWERAAEQLRDVIERFPGEDGVSGMRLALAQILVKRQRPAKALETLEAIPAARLDEEQRAQLVQLTAHARAEIDRGVLELDD